MDRIAELFFVTLTVLGRKIALFSDGRILPIVSGGADEGEPEEITVPDDLNSLDEDTARDLHAKLEERFQAQRKDASTKERIEALRQIRATQARLAERVNAIVTERAEVAQGLESLDAEGSTLPDPAAPSPEANTPDPQQVTPAPAQAAGTAPVVAPTPITAGVTPPDISGGQTPTEQNPAPVQRPRVSYVASAGQTIAQINQEVDYEQIGRMVDSVKGLDGGKGEIRAYVAGLPAFEEMSGLNVPSLSRDIGVVQTDRMIREAVEDWKLRTGRLSEREKARLGRTAAICDPLDIIREIPDCSMDADPFGDSLPQRPAGRLGFQFTQAISLSAVSPGVTAGWSDALQSFVDPTNVATWKPCVDIECPTPQSIRAEAVTACVRFDITTEMSNPERVQDILKKLAAMRVRARTQRLLTIADSLSSAYTFETAYDFGALPALVEASMSVLARAIYAERIDPTAYNIYLPPGLLETVATDLAGKAFQEDDAAGEAEALADVQAEIESLTGLKTIRMWDVAGANPFAALNAPGAAAAALPALGCENTLFQVRFIAPEAALYFSTGEEKTGIESSPELMRQNKRQWFSEEFVGLAKHGCHPWFTVSVELQPNGARTGFVTPVAC